MRFLLISKSSNVFGLDKDISSGIIENNEKSSKKALININIKLENSSNLFFLEIKLYISLKRKNVFELLVSLLNVLNNILMINLK